MKDNLYYKAAMAQFQAKADEARAVLDTFFNNSVGIGEHSKILDEVTHWTKVLSEAEECIETLEVYASEEEV